MMTGPGAQRVAPALAELISRLSKVNIPRADEATPQDITTRHNAPHVRELAALASEYRKMQRAGQYSSEIVQGFSDLYPAVLADALLGQAFPARTFLRSQFGQAVTSGGMVARAIGAVFGSAANDAIDTFTKDQLAQKINPMTYGDTRAMAEVAVCLIEVLHFPRVPTVVKL